MKFQSLFAIVPAIVFMTGCIGSVDEVIADEEMIADVEQALEIDNALNPNALNPNALNPNALNPNALNPNALNPNALSPEALSSLQRSDDAGALSRMLMKYLVSCALDNTQSFSFSWTNSSGVVQNEVYRGLLGLATSWATMPLNEQGQMMVSACLASRTNYYGLQVTISSRSSVEPLKSNTSQGEYVQYDKVEGAFWGNLFAPTPYLHACYRNSVASYARSVYRDCAAGHVKADGSIEECGMIEIVGTCNQYCSSWSFLGHHYSTCGIDAASQTANVITVGLR